MGARSFETPKMSPSVTSTSQMDIVIWAAREDDKFVRQAVTHLAPARRSYGLTIANFLDDIAAGTGSIRAVQRLASAHIRLMLISPDFFASLTSNPDMEEAANAVGARLRAAQAEGRDYRIVPTLVRHINQESYEDNPLSKIQGLPRNGRPVEAWRSQDEAWAGTVEELRRVLKDLGCLKPVPKKESSWL